MIDDKLCRNTAVAKAITPTNENKKVLALITLQ